MPPHHCHPFGLGGDLDSDLESDLTDPPDSDMDLDDDTSSDDLDSLSDSDSTDSLDDDLADKHAGERVGYGDLDPNEINYDSDDEDCKSVLHNEEVLEVIYKMTVKQELLKLMTTEPKLTLLSSKMLLIGGSSGGRGYILQMCSIA